jgi:hypothetical protein
MSSKLIEGSKIFLKIPIKSEILGLHLIVVDWKAVIWAFIILDLSTEVIQILYIGRDILD